MPFQVGTDLDSVTGTLDHQSTATVDGLNGRFATVRLGANASDDAVRHERKTIMAGLEQLLEQERRDTEAREAVYQELAWHEKPLVSTGALFQGASDAGVALFDFAVGVADLLNPSKRMMDSLTSAWIASKYNSDKSWYEVFTELHDGVRHERWVRAIGFSPSDISREDIASAYELASLVMTDDQLRAALKDFTADYARIQHHTEYTYLGGAVAFELVLAGVLAAATLGAGNAAQASSRIRHARILAVLGPAFGRFGEALKLQGLRRVWRDADLNQKHHFEDEARPRPKPVEAEPTFSNNSSAANSAVHARHADELAALNRQELLDELGQSGIKHTPENIVDIRKAQDGKIVFLETGNRQAGLEHILVRHEQDFANVGIHADQIPNAVMTAVTQGKVIGYQGKNKGRAIYDVVFNDTRHQIGVTTSDNGFVVGANPQSRMSPYIAE